VLSALARGLRAGDANGTGPVTMADDPVRHWEVAGESGVLWRVTGSATPLSYTVLPQILTVKSPLVGTIRPLAGGDFVVRNRFSLLVEPITAGPEHHYLGASASGLLEWWNHRRTCALFLASGGGIGWLDSKGQRVAGAQGENFNFNWLVYPGVRCIWNRSLSASLGAYFQHVSNSGFNKVNPGLNAIGPMLSLGWRF
jgi:hypothetical protein